MAGGGEGAGCGYTGSSRRTISEHEGLAGELRRLAAGRKRRSSMQRILEKRKQSLQSARDHPAELELTTIHSGGNLAAGSADFNVGPSKTATPDVNNPLYLGKASM